MKKLVFSFEKINAVGKSDKSFYNVLKDFNVADCFIYSRKGKVIFNKSSVK